MWQNISKYQTDVMNGNFNFPFLFSEFNEFFICIFPQFITILTPETTLFICSWWTKILENKAWSWSMKKIWWEDRKQIGKEKTLTNATNVNFYSLRQLIWGHILKHTAVKSQINASNVTTHLTGQAIWGDIWEHAAEKSQTNATNVTLHLLRQVIWGGIW